MIPSPSFTLELEQTADGVVLTAVGELDLQCEELWTARVAEACAAQPSAIIVDLAGVTFIDSSGLRLMIVGKNTADRAAIAVRLINIPPSVTRLFEMTGLLAEFDAPSPPDV